MQQLFRAMVRLSRFSVNVLLNGESGTGKELVARALHCLSPRANRPFIALNMAAIPRDLVESELFGHERGAFTGAQARRVGRFVQADGGTLFLDEIGDMPAELQTRLLRVLSNGEFYPIGAHSPCKVDVRIIAATHRDLETEVAEQRFREDLFYRLNVVRLQIPPLRERRDDIPLLFRHFLKTASTELNEETKILSAEALEFLCCLDWPGNVRQLENVCYWIAVMTPLRKVRLDDLPPELFRIKSDAGLLLQGWQDAFRLWVDMKLRTGEDRIGREAIASMEKILIETTLEFTRGHRQQAARRLGYGRNTLTNKINTIREQAHSGKILPLPPGRGRGASSR